MYLQKINLAAVQAQKGSEGGKLRGGLTGKRLTATGRP